jgi:hypothetical protein
MKRRLINRDMLPLREWSRALCLLLVLLSFHAAISSAKEVFSTTNHQAISVWSTLTVEAGDAYSSFGERPIEDCLRPKRVDCFSIQQNFWISDSTNKFVLWAQNTVELARLDNSIYYGTFAFQVWNNSLTRQPVLCEPESSRGAVCRAPFFTDPFRFPQTFTFYSHISNEGSTNVLRMSNNFGSVSWVMPGTLQCPCHIGTISESAPPWGQSPFELVLVGLDAFATAVFRNNTYGSFRPTLVEFSDGGWHEASMNAIHCPLSSLCTMLATGENSMYLAWNSTLGEFHWAQTGSDQGAYISDISTVESEAPLMPNPQIENLLYVEFRSAYAYLTMYDAEHRALGVDPKSGQRIQEIPNASITHDSTEDLLLVNPAGVYELLVTSAGNSAFELYVSKVTNVGGLSVSRDYKDRLNVGYTKRINLDVGSMKLMPQEATLTTNFAPISGIVLTLIALAGLITAILFFRRKRLET